ncbi:hypothetical protein SLE2022_240540 [Rubroshorea leprosula]
MVDAGRRNTLFFPATFLSLFVTSLLLTNGEAFDYPSIVEPPFSQTNVVPTDFSYWESAGVRPILINGSFVCGFHCKFEGTACLFAISIFRSSFGGNSSFSPQMVWSANRNSPIGLWAKLQLSQEGDLTLQDVHGTLVWSTKTAGKSVSGLKLTHQGNLVLFDRNDETVWQSFEHPTDSLVVGQRLVSGQILVANRSVTNWSEGLYSFSIDDDGYFVAYMESDPAQLYYRSKKSQLRTGQFYAELTNTSFGASLSPGSGFSFIQLGSDGKLRFFGWVEVESNWKEVFNLPENRCDYPLMCGEYGICSAGRCSCPEPDENGTTYFRQLNRSQPELGCSPYIPTSCEFPYQHSLLELKNVDYLPRTNYHITDIESCKQGCLNNCSCKYTLFIPDSNSSSLGHCLFRSEVFAFQSADTSYNQSLFLKVQSSIVKPPISYINNISDSSWESEELTLQPFLVNGNFVCGFHCKVDTKNNTCLFAISIFHSDSTPYPNFKMVWSANRNKPIGLGAKLQFSQEGDLTLQDDHDTLVWSTNTIGKFVSGMKLTHQGNLILFDGNNKTVWQSFDHPTDCLVLGQRLVSGQKLKANMSATDWTEGLYSFSIGSSDGYFVASIGSDATLDYYYHSSEFQTNKKSQFYAEFNDTNFGAFTFARAGVSFIQLGSDGNLRSFSWVESEWKEVDDFFKDGLNRCDYPLACGEYGICSMGGGCNCPEPDENNTAHFKMINSDNPDLGCSPNVPISCESSSHESLLEIKHVSLSTSYLPDNSNITDIESCKQACLNNCSCKFAVFRSYNPMSGQPWCFFGSEALSFRREVDAFYNSSVFLKVQSSITGQSSPIVPNPQRNLSSPAHFPQRKKRQNVGVILAIILGATFIGFFIFTIFLLKIKKDPKDVEEDYLGHISGTPTRFSYEELKVATNNFSNKLGEGGFGCVFQGTLPCGAQIAVKCLDGFGPVKKSFIAEVETIGSIHHFNLVRLVGFCAEKSHMLLVYEYMCNGSLDQWIFCRDKALALGWQCRRKIILEIANGLAYLHGGCRQKIIHLDIKPQNILLEENFNAKVSDFGLSKLVGRDQSQIVTTMRGTPGYMAPEWLNSVITEKVDVYSFGIVVLEILCGRKNVDRSLPEEDAHLVSLFKRKVEDGQFLDLVDKYNEEMQSNAAEVVEMMKVAAWCLQGEYAKRPSMSIIVKFLEGKMDDENEYDFSNPPPPAEVETHGHQMDAVAITASPLIPSILSGPR